MKKNVPAIFLITLILKTCISFAASTGEIISIGSAEM